MLGLTSNWPIFFMSVISWTYFRLSSSKPVFLKFFIWIRAFAEAAASKDEAVQSSSNG